MDLEEMGKKLDEVLENMTDEEIEMYFPKSKTTKGWVSINVSCGDVGYFVCSIGEASPETIRQYILSQG